MISVFGWPDPNTSFNQSEHALYTCYFITLITCFSSKKCLILTTQSANQKPYQTFTIKIVLKCNVITLHKGIVT